MILDMMVCNIISATSNPFASMSSTARSPIDHFENLSLDTQMTSTNPDVISRARKVRDVLSSFDRDVLPAEFKPETFEKIDRPSRSSLPASELTIQNDLKATLLQWGAYDDVGFKLLTSLQSEATLTRCFYEKLGRRFRDLFHEYDRLQDEHDSHIRPEIQRIAQGFRDVVKAVEDDRVSRVMGQASIAQRLVEAMSNICRRDANMVQAPQSPVTPRKTRRNNSNAYEGPLNLYEALIKRPGEDQSSHLFMVDLLETFPSHVFADMDSDYTNLISLLDIHGAPSAYKYRIGRLASEAEPIDLRAGDMRPRSQSTGGRVPISITTRRLAQETSERQAEAQAIINPVASHGEQDSNQDRTTTGRGPKRPRDDTSKQTDATKGRKKKTR